MENKCSTFEQLSRCPLIVESALLKTAFTFNNIIFEQKDGESMGASLGPALENIIMTECEKVIVDNLVKERTIKFYVR